jgi:hypothetical protein
VEPYLPSVWHQRPLSDVIHMVSGADSHPPSLLDVHQRVFYLAISVSDHFYLVRAGYQLCAP